MATHNIFAVDLALIEGNGNRCGSCHKAIRPLGGVVFGRPVLKLPAINICRKCVEIALALLGPDAAQKVGHS
jgi:hypothetical protein